MEIFPGGMPKFWKFRRGGGGDKILRVDFRNSRGEGGYKANPFCGGGGMDIFWNYTYFFTSFVWQIKYVISHH